MGDQISKAVFNLEMIAQELDTELDCRRVAAEVRRAAHEIAHAAGGFVVLEPKTAALIRKVFLPANPNKMRKAAPETVAAVKALISAVESKHRD